MMQRGGEVAIVTGASRGIDRAVIGRLGYDDAGTVHLKSAFASAQKATQHLSVSADTRSRLRIHGDGSDNKR